MPELRCRIRRGPDSWSEHRVPTEEGMTVFGALYWIYERQDPTLAFDRHFCKLGTCTACLMLVNGKPCLACRTLVPPDGELRLEPVGAYPLQRDLLVGRRD